MFIYKLLALLVLGAGVGSLLFLYAGKKMDRLDALEWTSLMVLLLCIKGYILRLLGVWNTMISVNYGDTIPWLSFGLGYSIILVLLTNGFESESNLKVEENQKTKKEHEFTSTIFLICFFVNLCLLVTASFSYLHIINNF